MVFCYMPKSFIPRFSFLRFSSVCVCARMPAYTFLVCSFKLWHCEHEPQALPLPHWDGQWNFGCWLPLWFYEWWGMGSGVGWGGAPGLVMPVSQWWLLLTPVGLALLFWPHPHDLCHISFFLMCMNILLYNDWPAQFPLLCHNCSYPLPIFLWDCLLFSYQNIGNFNILNLDPLADLVLQARSVLYHRFWCHWTHRRFWF